ncbi:MAG: T9SS type A sorting domain-containing protein [Saprospiraceae bacterium]|nr:T9SS type A sorting domain-containing protein [Saprospiraceae bacterium]
MKHYYLFLCLFFTIPPVFSQFSSPDLMWVNPIQSASDSPGDLGMQVIDVAVDINGSTYVAGLCTSPCAFATGVAIFPEAGGQSFFIAKYRSDGLFEWVKDLGTLGEHPAHIVAPSLDGVYLATSFSVNSVDLGNGISISKSCNNVSCNNALLAKFGPSGETLWAKTYKGSPGSNFQVSGVEPAGNNQIIALVSYDSEVLDLGPGFVFNNPVPSGFFLSVFHANNGATTDVRFPATFSSTPFTQTLAFNQTGQGVMTGIFFDQISFENGPTLTSSGEFGAHFVAGLDGSGNVQWARKISSSDYVDILASDVDNEGAAYLAIDASTDLMLDDGNILSINSTYAGAVLKLQGTSFAIPVYIPYDSDDYAVMDVAVHPWGQIFTVGYISEPISYGGNLVTPDGCVDAFMTVTNQDALPVSARSIGGNGCEAISNDYYGSCLGFDSGGFLYGAGGFLFNFNEDGFNFNGRGGFVAKFKTGVVDTDEPAFTALDIFPNPNAGAFTIRLPEAPGNLSQMIITNTQGQEVYRHQVTQQDIQVNQSFPSGLYLVRVQDGKRLYQGKIRME